jgi:alpha-ketoglutarate-dependent taurine dioxygenase
MEDITVAFKWVKGDVLLVDNRQAMHSRRSFSGTRKIYASLATHSTR